MKRILLLLLIIYPLSRFCHHQTKGFRLSKLQNNTTCFVHQTSEPMPEELKQTLDQNFTYLGRGLQSFSFVSEDGKTVLKFFNNRYQRRLFWFGFPILRKLKERRIEECRYKWKRTFTSYRLASQLLKEETGLLYLHPGKGANLPEVTIIDPIGCSHQIALSNYAFALQKRAQGSFPFFAECEKTNNVERAKTGLSSLVQLMKKKAELGIRDSDPLIRTNIGFIEGKAMQIDLGPFTEDQSVKDSLFQKEEIARILMGLRTFMEKNTPNLLPYLDAEIASL